MVNLICQDFKSRLIQLQGAIDEKESQIKEIDLSKRMDGIRKFKLS